MQRVGCELQISHSIGPSLCLPTLRVSVQLQKVLHKTRWNPDTFLKSGQWGGGYWPAQQTEPPSICCQLNRLITGTAWPLADTRAPMQTRQTCSRRTVTAVSPVRYIRVHWAMVFSVVTLRSMVIASRRFEGMSSSFSTSRLWTWKMKRRKSITLLFRALSL